MPAMVDVKKEIESGSVLKADYESNKVPNLIGRSGTNVIPVLENMGLDVQYRGVGKVKSQSIPAGTPFRKGQTIYLDLEG